MDQNASEKLLDNTFDLPETIVKVLKQIS